LATKWQTFGEGHINDVWKIKANPNDVFKAREKEPKPKEFAAILAATQKTLKEKTGYVLRERPVGLSLKKTKEQNQKIITDEADPKNKLINTELDTGYDIVGRE
jgi:hypothetical protein